MNNIQPLSALSQDDELFAGYPDLLTVKHLAEITGVSEQTIRREIRLGVIPSLHIGRRLLCPKRDFIKYVENEVKNER
jgi:DNA-binding protein, excisionase family